MRSFSCGRVRSWGDRGLTPAWAGDSPASLRVRRRHSLRSCRGSAEPRCVGACLCGRSVRVGEEHGLYPYCVPLVLGVGYGHARSRWDRELTPAEAGDSRRPCGSAGGIHCVHCRGSAEPLAWGAPDGVAAPRRKGGVERGAILLEGDYARRVLGGTSRGSVLWFLLGCHVRCCA